MCGICGIVGVNNTSKPVDQDVLLKMTQCMQHRGPDEQGIYLKGQVGLGSRRLSIIDLTSGRQPITNEDESMWIVFNGEIYNYRELRIYLQKKGVNILYSFLPMVLVLGATIWAMVQNLIRFIKNEEVLLSSLSVITLGLTLWLLVAGISSYIKQKQKAT